MRLAFALVVLAAFAALTPALGACCSRTALPPAAAAGDAEGGIADLTAKTVALVTERRDGGGVRVFCTGTWVGERTVLTANHCVEDAGLGDRVRYATRDDVLAPEAVGGGLRERDVIRPRPAHLARRDAEHDLALLEVDGDDVPAHAVARFADAYVGQPVQTMGHPLGLWYSYSAGVVSALRWLDTGAVEAVFVQTTAAVSPGNSGGGLFNMRGELVGVCRGGLPRGQALNLYVASSYARALVGAGVR